MKSDLDPRFISRRKFLQVTAASIGTLALTGCGGGAAPEAAPEGVLEEAGEALEEAEAALEPTPTITPLVLGTGGQRVVFWHGLGGADGATMVQMLQEYSAEAPDISLSSETLEWSVFYQKLPTSIAAGTPPNIALLHSWAIQQLAAQFLVQSADDLFFEPGLIPKDDFNAGLIEEISVDGAAQAVPFDYHGWLNYVNTKVIEDAGLDPGDLPANGDEFIDWALQVVVDDEGRHPDEDGFDPDRVAIWATHSSWQRFTLPSTIWQYGGGIFTDDGTESLLAEPETLAAVQYWHDLIFEYRVVPPAVPGVAVPPDLFATNAIALMWDGTWLLNFFKDNPEAAEVMEPAYINSLAPDGNQAVRFDSHIMVVPVGVADANLVAAVDLITWLSDHGELWATSGQVPARTRVLESAPVQEIETVQVAGAQFEEIGRAGQSHPAINEIVTTYEAAFSAILADAATTEEAMLEAHEAVQQILDRA